MSGDVDVSGNMDNNNGASIDLDTATDLSRQPWTQTASPFAPDSISTTSTTTVKAPRTLTSADINARRKAKTAGAKKLVSASANGEENTNDVEWIVDAFSADTPESSEAVVKGMGSSGRSVNRRRQQQQQQQQQGAPKIDAQEGRILKSRLDELRKANGLYVSEPVNQAAEQKLIDYFKPK